jgi:hypothetical protein
MMSLGDTTLLDTISKAIGTVPQSDQTGIGYAKGIAPKNTSEYLAKIFGASQKQAVYDTLYKKLNEKKFVDMFGENV